jgi:26S proteasome regulatory subunit T5
MTRTPLQVMRSEMQRLQHEADSMKEKVRENGDKIKQNKVLPYLVSNVVEVSEARLAR